MRASRINAERLERVRSRLGDAAVDPAVWQHVMDEISAAVGATGSILLQSDVRTSNIPRTKGADELTRTYFANGWHVHDIRAERAVPLQLRGVKVVTEQDILTPEEMRRSAMYNELFVPLGFMWWAVVGFWAGSALWGLCIQRSTQEGPFEATDKRALAGLSQRLTETATLSKAVGRAVLSGITNTLNLIKQPALALDRLGFVLDVNPAAEQIFDVEVSVRDRRLFLRDYRAKSAFDTLVDQIRNTPDTDSLDVAPIVVQRRMKRPLVIHILPVDGAARSPFLGARALLIFSDSSRRTNPRRDVLGQAFGLSPAEARLASLIATGISPEQAADELGIARETARNQLKAAFAKTDTHRQNELTALLSRL